MRKFEKQAITVHSTGTSGRRLSRPAANFVLALGSLLLMQTGFAQDEEAVDLEAVTAAEAATPRFEVPPDPKRPYLDAIDRIEEEQGPYATNLSDLYLGLGEEFLKEGDYENARDAYHRGVMVVRVNSGPNSPEQTNLLYLIANIEVIMEEPKQAEKILENIRFVNTQYYGEGHPELLPVYERMYQWYQTTVPLDVDESSYKEYVQRIGLVEDMLEITENAYGAGSAETAIAYRRLAEAHFQAMRFAMAEEEWIEPRIIVSSDVPYQVTAGFEDRSMREHYIEGRDAFRRYNQLIQGDPTKTALDYAEGLADLADWSLLFDKYRAARRLYEQAYQVLAQSEEYAGLAESYLGQPKPMEFTGLQPPLVDGVQLGPHATSLDVSMTVTRIGDVRYVEFLNPPETMSEDDLTRIKRELQDTPFRPSLKQGKAVTTEGFIWQHVIRIEPDEEARPEERTS